jgi:asparagine synthase (glutamine-hydrolysing)
MPNEGDMPRTTGDMPRTTTVCTSMCGIVGFVSARDAAPPDASDVRAAVRALAHRGPDQDGVFEAPGVALGFARLSIIDLPGGSQPMTNEDGSVVVVYNGEIWNYKSLRTELSRLGHTFSTRSDTEVLVHGYEEWGDDLVDHLDGMFAFAIWDARTERLVLARDRFGKKPLYVRATREGVAFGSDARSVHLVTRSTPTIATERVGEYLFQRYVVSPATLFAGVDRLPPAYRATYDRERYETAEYWRAAIPVDPAPLGSRDVRELLSEATARRLMSDVPLGILLSGGVDSTAILALATAAGAGELATFTVGFDDPVYDERHRARAAAMHFGSDHHELTVDPATFVDAWSRLAWYRDEPIAEASEIPLLLLAEFAGKQVRVVLSGDGGDEVFGGYPKYRADAILRRSGKAGELALRGALGVMRRRRSHRQLDRAATTLAIRDPFLRWVSWFRTPGPMTELLRPELQPAPVAQKLASDLAGRLRGFGDIDAGRLMLLGDILTYLPENMLLRSDKVLMAASLEGRMPLMDVRLVERAASASAGSRSAIAQGKRVLREAISELVPKELLGGPKRGFPVPLDRLLVDDMRVVVRNLLLSERLADRKIFDPDRLRAAIDGDNGGRLPDQAVFVLACFELWARANVDDVTTEPKPAAALFELAGGDSASAALAAVG